MADRKILKKGVRKIINAYVQLLEKDGMPVHSVYVFGSCANNKYRGDSDIDLCIVSPESASNADDLENKMWLGTLKVDTRIEPIMFTPKTFIDDNPLVFQIKNSGIKIK